MKRMMMVAGVLAVSVAPVIGAGYNSVSGTYVEARTAEVFTGGCIMGSEAETTGRQAILAWKVGRGNFNGQPLDGLSVIAAIEGDKNLGIYEVGGARAVTNSVVLVDQRASSNQQLALVAMARDLAGPIMGTVVDVRPSAIEFADTREQIAVTTAQV